MKRFFMRVCPIFVMLFLSACGENGIYGVKAVLNGDLTIPAGTVEQSAILLVDGSLTVADGGVVEGDVYQFLGIFHLNGLIKGQVVQLSGEMQVGDSAQVEGDVQVSGGRQVGLEAGKVSGQIHRSQVNVPFSPQWLQDNLQNQIGWMFGETLILTALAVFLSYVYPRRLERLRQALAEYPHVAGAMGLLVMIVGLALVVQMLFTVLLIPVSILSVLLMLLAVGIGWAGFGELTGRWLSQRIGRSWSDPMKAGVGTFCFMLVINLFALLPGIGDLLSIASAVAGLGGVFLTRFGSRRYQAAPYD